MAPLGRQVGDHQNGQRGAEQRRGKKGIAPATEGLGNDQACRKADDLRQRTESGYRTQRRATPFPRDVVDDDGDRQRVRRPGEDAGDDARADQQRQVGRQAGQRQPDDHAP